MPHRSSGRLCNPLASFEPLRRTTGLGNRRESFEEQTPEALA
jgi:hypothetical protein